MLLPVPHLYQPNDYTCGPASLWMLARFFEKRVALTTLIGHCRATPKTGTTRETMKRALRCLGFDVHARYGASLKEIERRIDNRIPTIVNYREPGEGLPHFAVVVGMTRTHILLNDPIHGPGVRIPRRVFLNHWYGTHRTQFTRWVLVAAPPSGLALRQIDEKA